MPCRLIRGAHEWVNVVRHFRGIVQARQRAWGTGHVSPAGQEVPVELDNRARVLGHLEDVEYVGVGRFEIPLLLDVATLIYSVNVGKPVG